MDPNSAAQDASRCEICETNVVQMYCHTCEASLCRTCVGNHVTLNPKIEHQILGLGLHKSSLVYTRCGDHLHKCCHFYCKECDVPVCAICISTKKHCHHVFLQISQVFESKQKVIEKDTQILEEVVRPKYEHIAKDTENILEHLDVQFGKTFTMISEHGKKWHQKIDLIVTELNAKLHEIKNEQVYAMRKHLSHIKNSIVAIEDAIVKNKGTLSSNEVIKTLNCQNKFSLFNKLPETLKIQSPIFSEGSIQLEEVGPLFGSLQTFPIIKQNENETLNLPGDLSSSLLLDEPEVVATFHTGFQRLCNVACTDAENIWTSGRESIIKEFNQNGSCLKNVMTTSGMWPADIAWKGTGELLYSDSVAKTINVVKWGPVQKLMKFKSWKPGNICLSSSGDLLVTLCSEDETQVKVARYRGSVEKENIQFDENGKPLYSGNSKIKYLKENRNLDICVADSEAGAVVVVNQAGKLRFRYTGQPSHAKRKPFKPYGITTDTQGHILTSDSDSHCIHIIDQAGQFLCYLRNCDLKNPNGLCVDHNHNLFVAEYNTGKIKVIKYLQSPDNKWHSN